MRTKNINVTHNPEEHRFELTIEGHLAELTYRMNENTIVFTHTGVPPALDGRGLGINLVETGLEYARTNCLKVRSRCWFMSKYLQRHPEYHDLLE